MMRLLSNRRGFGAAVAVVTGGWLALGACGGTPVGVVDDDAAMPDAMQEASGEATVDGSDAASGNDATADGGRMVDATVDAGEGGAPDAGSDATAEASPESGSMQDAPPGDAPSADAPSADAPSDAAPEAAADAASDSSSEAAACGFAGTWSMTVQTITAVPPLCQGVMDCTNCQVFFNATSTQPTATTIDWNVDPGGVLCTAFNGSITPGGQFTTSETNCSPVGDGTTFDGQIDVAACSVTATYVYALSGCTITETMTGTEQ